jgi:hypothetical protein
MLKAGSGRKVDDPVWKYFHYEASKDLCTCIVETANADEATELQDVEGDKGENSKLKCGAILKGKNATNLKNHIRYKHKELIAELDKSQKKDNSTKRNKDADSTKVSCKFFNSNGFTYRMAIVSVIHYI